MGLVVERGFEGLSLPKIAKELDLTTSALYWYYGSREALIVALQVRALADLERRVGAARAQWRELDTGRRPKTRALMALVRLARLLCALPERAPGVDAVLAYSVPPRRWLDDRAGAPLGDALVAACAEGVALFEAAAEASALSPGVSQTRALSYWSALQGATRMRSILRLAPPLQADYGRVIASGLLVAWGASPRALDAAWRSTEPDTHP